MRNPLKPQDTVQKILLSSPAKIVGGFSDTALLISHAWPTSPRQVHTQFYGEGTVFARTFLVGAYETEPLLERENDNPRILPRYDWVGDRLCILLSILFGKRFENHGFLESHGMFNLPDLGGSPPILGRALPFLSDGPRVDLGIPLNLVEFGRIAPLMLDESCNGLAADTLFTAGRFYVRSLRTSGDEPDLAYLDLVSCGEALSGYYEYSDAEIYSTEMLKLLDEIRTACARGEKKARVLKCHLRQVKQRWLRTLLALLQPSFFDATESLEDWCRLRRVGLEKRLKAAYDIRSKYLHSGSTFGGHLMVGRFLNEVPAGQPVVEDQDWGKALGAAPTIVGLERILRYALLRFIHIHACRIDCRLDGPGLVAMGTGRHETSGGPDEELPEHPGKAK